MYTRYSINFRIFENEVPETNFQKNKLLISSKSLKKVQIFA